MKGKKKMNEVINQLIERRSVRVFTDRKITAREKSAILQAAVNAPTAGCQQLYTIIDVTDQNLKERLAESCDHQPFIAEAPLVLIFCADYRRWMKKFEACGCGDGNPEKPEEGNLLLACNDAIIAAQSAVVAAESLGIGSCYIGDVLENCETHVKLLNLPEAVIPITMIVFGKPTEQQKTRPQLGRFAQNMIVFENSYRDLTEEEITEFAADRNITAFYNRKHISDFMHEMNRSSRALIQHWLGK